MLQSGDQAVLEWPDGQLSLFGEKRWPEARPTPFRGVWSAAVRRRMRRRRSERLPPVGQVAVVFAQEPPLLRLDEAPAVPCGSSRPAACRGGSCPSSPSAAPGNALANISSGQVKFGPLILRSLHSHSRAQPTRHAVGPHQLRLSGTQVHLPALHDQLPLQRASAARFSRTPVSFCHPRVVQRREDRRNEEREQPAPLHFVDQVERRPRRPRRSRPGCRSSASSPGTSCCGSGRSAPG